MLSPILPIPNFELIDDFLESLDVADVTINSSNPVSVRPTANPTSSVNLSQNMSSMMPLSFQNCSVNINFYR